MDARIENVLAGIATTPAAYGMLCWLRRSLHARRAARWARDAHRAEWDGLHWLVRRNAWAAVQALISKGVIPEPEGRAFRDRDEYLETATWVGVLITVVLLLAIVAWHHAAGLLG